MAGWHYMSLQNPNKTIVICNFPRFSGEIWLPYLWASAKTYYERHGERANEWRWYPCYADVYGSDYKENIKKVLKDAKPDIFSISLYVWNYSLAHEIAEWVKTTWPNCIVTSGGPHQYFKHDLNWFKKHWYLDASHPGDCYGELCFKEILDNYDDTSRTVDWNLVTDMRYPSQKSRNLLVSEFTMSRKQKKNYDYDWAALHEQQHDLQKFVDYQKQHFPRSLLLSVLETTRGCPYGCTYCDWGGGTNTAVIQKSITNVKQDIDAVLNFDLTYLYFADANFGIFGERDTEIIRYLAERKHQTKQLFKTGYGGFAKTENRLQYIKEILKVDVDNDLSLTKELKLSLQTLDDVVLNNIDRKNISLEQQLEVYQPLAKDNQLPLYVEMIMGLPGITLEKYYRELDVLGDKGLSVQWFEWILLPEAPAYAYEYRDKYQIKTISKIGGWAVHEENSDREVVVGCHSYTTQHYLQMILSNGIYHLLVQGGYYKDTFGWIRKNCGKSYGDIIRNIYEEYFLLYHENLVNEVNLRWQQILENPKTPCTFWVSNEEIYAQWYFIMLAFNQTDDFNNRLMTWVARQYSVPAEIINNDRKLTLTSDNINKKFFDNWCTVIDFKKQYSNSLKNSQIVEGLFRNYVRTGYILRGERKFLGLFAIKN